MNEQAKALADGILDVIGMDVNDELMGQIVNIIDATFCPPCTDCGAEWKPRAQWRCGSWNEPPARQVAVKCVQRQLAKVRAELVDRQLTDITTASATVDPHDGPAVAELADGLLDDRSPSAKGQVRRALESISKALGGLHVCMGNDELGGFGVKMYGVPRRKMVAVRVFFAEKALVHV